MSPYNKLHILKVNAKLSGLIYKECNSFSSNLIIVSIDLNGDNRAQHSKMGVHKQSNQIEHEPSRNKAFLHLIFKIFHNLKKFY